MKKNFNCTIERKTFTKEDKEIAFFVYSVEINGNRLNLNISENDKRFANYLLRDIFETEKGVNK